MTATTPWFEDFFEGVYGRVLGTLYDPAKSREQARIVKRLMRARKGDSVLDVPCGQGRLSIPLADMGLAVTGVDRTAAYLRRARALARKHEVSARFLRCDMREIQFDAEFDAAFNWFGSFGYFSDEENLAFARRVFAALKPGGRFLVEGMNQSWLLANFRQHSETTFNGVQIVNTRSWDADTKRIFDTWKMTYREKTESHTIDMRIYDASAIRALLRAAGFRDIELCGYPNLGRLTRHSPRWVAIARRPHG